MSHFLVPFVSIAIRQLGGATQGQRAHIIDALATLLGPDDAAIVVRSAQTSLRCRRYMSATRAIALVQAPVDFLASAAIAGPTLFVRSHGAIPAGCRSELFRAASRPAVRPLPLRGL